MHGFQKWIILLCAIVECGYSTPTSGPTENELECYSQKKVYHEESGKCYKVLTKGPCKEGEWLVLEKPDKGENNPRIKPYCAKEKCGEGEYYWPSTQSCVEPKDKTILCAPKEELVSNLFGEGECDCSREPLTVRLNSDKKYPCYQLYTQGPCRVGQVMGIPPEGTTPACMDDPCHEESLRRKKEGTLPKHGMLAPFTNGTCYELGTRGPCPEDLIFKVHVNFLTPGCISLTTTIFNIQKPQNCYQDENGDCQRVHSVTKQAGCSSLVSNIFSGIKNCPVDENGDCQKQVAKKKGNKYLKELAERLKNK